MDKQYDLMQQVKVVLNILNKEYSDEITGGVLQLIYKRYNNALEILKNKKNIQDIKIKGGIRAYMDSYSDYNNPLLEEMYKAEKILKELLA